MEIIMTIKYWQTMAERENSGTSNTLNILKYAPNAVEEAPEPEDTADADTAEAVTEETETAGHSNLPRPIAFIFKILLAPLAIVGVTLLFALICVITVTVTAMSLGAVALGIFLIVEGISNFSAAHYASFECMGIGFVAVALGLLLFTLALRCILRLVPHTSGLYSRSLRGVGRL